MTTRGKKNKAVDNGTDHNDLPSKKSKKDKIAPSETDGKGDRKGALVKDAPAITGDSKMHDILESSGKDGKPEVHYHSHDVCWHCGKLCPPTTGYCFSCLLFKSSEDIDKHPLPRKMIVESPMMAPVSNKEFFSLLMTGLIHSVGRVTQITQRKDAPLELPLPANLPKIEYSLITHKLTERFVTSLISCLQRAKGLLSSTVMQLQIDVVRGNTGDLFTLTYRSPSNAVSTHLPCDHNAGFEGFMACRTHYFVDQDNDEEKKLGLGHGEVQVPPGFVFGVPLSEASFKETTISTLLPALLDGFKSNMADLQQMRVQKLLADADAEPLDDPKGDLYHSRSYHTRTSAPVIKQQKIAEVFKSCMAPVLDFCIIIGKGRVLPMLLGDTPGHNMSGDKKTVIFNLF